MRKLRDVPAAVEETLREKGCEWREPELAAGFNISSGHGESLLQCPRALLGCEQRADIVSSLCHRFITKKGRQVCANPNDVWVQSYLENLKQK